MNDSKPWTGPVYPWNQWPIIGPGVAGPLEHAPFFATQTPDIQRTGWGYSVTFRRYGFPTGFYGTGEDWGLGDRSAPMDADYQFTDPADTPEVLRIIDVQRCRIVEPSESGNAYELAHASVGDFAVGVLEQIPTILDVEALDENGDVVYAFGNTNGERPCVSSLIHPDPAVGPLTWEFVLLREHRPGFATEATNEAYVGPIPSSMVFGASVLLQWADARYGNRAAGTQRLQLVVPAHSRVRLFGIVTAAEPERWRINMGGRLGGYWQSTGRLGAALRSATVRTS